MSSEVNPMGTIPLPLVSPRAPSLVHADLWICLSTQLYRRLAIYWCVSSGPSYSEQQGKSLPRAGIPLLSRSFSASRGMTRCFSAAVSVLTVGSSPHYLFQSSALVCSPRALGISQEHHGHIMIPLLSGTCIPRNRHSLHLRSFTHAREAPRLGGGYL